jgi:hypothetical protein
LINRLRRLSPKNKPWEQENKELNSRMREILEEVASDFRPLSPLERDRL